MGRSESDSPEALAREARLLERQGLLEQAIGAYRDMLLRWPDLADSWYALAVLERRMRQYANALASFQQALDRGVTRPEEVHLNRGVIYSDHLRMYDAAERELRAALALNPHYVPAHMNLANLHEDLGHRNEALAAYERILEIDPGAREALARCANLHRFENLDDPLFGRLRRAIADPAAGDTERASLGFALGRALDACGSYAEAFRVYTQANQASRASAGPGAARYDRPFEEARIDRFIAAFSSSRKSAATHVAGPRPIFVCGMFRSGSTLIEQLLAGHPRITAGGELDLIPHLAAQILATNPASILDVPASRLAAAAAWYLEGLRELYPQAEFVTDKRPDNFLYIGLIKALFSEAKFVHTVREPLDNCLSVYFLHLDQRMSYALDLMDIGHHYRLYRRLMAHWKALYGADIYDVSYDALVRDPKPVMNGLFEFLGLDAGAFSPAAAQGATVKTASVWQVREPLYRRSSGRWRNYAIEVQALRAYLAEGAARGN